MTNPTPTDRDAVERLAHLAEGVSFAHMIESHQCKIDTDDAQFLLDTISALLAERDHAEAEKQAAVKAMQDNCGEIVGRQKRYWEDARAEIREQPAPTGALDRAIEAAELRGMREAVTICKRVRREVETEDQAVGALESAIAILDVLKDREAAILARTEAPK